MTYPPVHNLQNCLGPSASTASKHAPRPAPIDDPAGWVRLLFGLTLVFGIFQVSAVILGSDRGQAGLIVGALVVAATAAVERLMFGRRLLEAFRELGLGPPRAPALVVTGIVGGLLLLVVFVFVHVTGASIGFFPGWTGLLAGLFAQAGIAEEILFRGYLFGHLRQGRSFWRAAVVSMLPFVGVHLVLFFTMPWPVALAAVLLSVALSFPLAHLFEVGGNTIWAPALLHFIIQATVKIVVLPETAGRTFPLVWMLASALVPLLALLVGTRQEEAAGAGALRVRA